MQARHSLLALALVACAGCKAVRGENPPTTNVSMGVATQYWFRGVPQSDALVAQGDITLTMPFANGDTLVVTAWGNEQLSSSTGRGVFPSGNGGDFSEIDLTGTYSAVVDEITVFGGAVSYNFPNAIAPSTFEVMGGVTFGDPIAFFSHTVTLAYDVDLADDFYASYGIASTNVLDERFTASFSGLVGFMGEDQAGLYFGTQRAGFSDASVTGVLNYSLDEFTNVFAKGTAVAVPDSRLRDAEEDRGFKTSTMIFTLGVGWKF